MRGAGRDFPAGAELCPAGTRLDARHLLALAAVGVARVPVRRKPRVALIATGKELVSPECELKPGQIRDASSTYLAAAVPSLGADFDFFGVVADDPDEFRSRLEKVLSGNYYDVVLTTGAVSMGTADFIPEAIKTLGAEILFHKTAIRPGKPGLFARFDKGPLFFGLPGNPVSTVVGPALLRGAVPARAAGTPGREPLRVRRCRRPSTSPKDCAASSRRGALIDGRIEILPGQASFQIQSLLSADCWAVLPEDGAHVKQGAEIDVYPLAESLA